MPSSSREIGSPDTALVEGVPRRDWVASRIESTSLPLSPRQTGKPNLGKDPVRTWEEVELIPSQGREAFSPLHGKLHENLSRDSFGVHRPPPTTLSWPRSRPPGEDLRGQSGCWTLSTRSAPVGRLVPRLFSPGRPLLPAQGITGTFRGKRQPGGAGLLKEKTNSLKKEPQMDSEGQMDIHSMEVSLWRIRPRREISKEKGWRISWRLLRNRGVHLSWERIIFLVKGLQTCNLLSHQYYIWSPRTRPHQGWLKAGYYSATSDVSEAALTDFFLGGRTGDFGGWLNVSFQWDCVIGSVVFFLCHKPVAMCSVKVLDHSFQNVPSQLWAFWASWSHSTPGGSNANVRLPSGKSKGQEGRRLGSPSGLRQQAPFLTLESHWAS